MPDRRRQRGPHPRDREAFGEDCLADLRRAVDDLSWLLSRQYPPRSALELVGNRYRLTARQRKGLQRCAAPESACAARAEKELAPAGLAHRAVHIDGYNVLLTVESAISGGLVLVGRDGAARDIAALSRHYRGVESTGPALLAIGSWLERHEVAEARWLLDRPISNSARLRGQMLELAGTHGLPWKVDLVANPDRPLASSREVVAPADSAILDRCRSWLSLARHVVHDAVPDAWVVVL